MHVGQRHDFDCVGRQAIRIFSGRQQVNAGQQAEVAALGEAAHVLHAEVQQVAEAIEDELASNPFDARRYVRVMPDDEVDAGFDHGKITQFLPVGGGRAHLQLTAVVDGKDAVGCVGGPEFREHGIEVASDPVGRLAGSRLARPNPADADGREGQALASVVERGGRGCALMVRCQAGGREKAMALRRLDVA